ncbi:glycosyltransferase [Bacillus sp. Marseille-Q3570]|uniref:glycosyltransferase n=1 Tax=Bacillus sp. Marseille-Q3570 TaxID=2963522 RepID=UPI0021B71D5C|nr:glycosyltransferase [Bacillus sp. Marseille-Q3570]
MISVITCTNKENCISKILENYNRQTWKEKELIIILNNDTLNLSEWKSQTIYDPSIRLLQISEETTLGECLNIGVKEAKHDFIAKFDDDDYYTEYYLTHSMKTLQKSNAKVVGKTTIYMYFEEGQTLQVFNPYKYAREEEQQSEKMYNPKVLMGGTLFFEKSVNTVVPFRDCNTGEDSGFCEDCIQKNIPIYSGTKDHYVYIRKFENNHTWKIKNQNLKRFSTHVITTDDFAAYLSDFNVL